MRLYTLLIAFFAWTSLWAVPAHQGIIRHRQKNGNELVLRHMGDEYLHYYLNIENGRKMSLGEDGDYHNIDNGTFRDMASAAEVRRSASAGRRSERLQHSPAMHAFGGASNYIGKKKGIVLLVNFQDIAMQGTSDAANTNYTNMFNKVGYNENNHIGSVHDYFLDQSYGQFDLDFDVVGPLTVSRDCAYYGGNDYRGNDLYPATMVIEACKLADAQGINFADYDWDGDGNVDQVFVIYAGYGENYGADANTIWPHEWTLSSAYFYGDGTGRLRLDGVVINTYAVTCELAGTSGTYPSGIGTACHEFSHCLGYPDLYDTDYSGGQGMDHYDVMCSGSYNGYRGYGEVPSGYTAYERWTAGWLTPKELNESTTIYDMPDLGKSPTAYIIYNEGARDECFILENRQSDRWFSYFDGYNAYHGLLITHLDYNETVWSSNRPNDDPSHQRMTWVPADRGYAEYDYNYGKSYVTYSQMRGDFFPGSGNVTHFNAEEWGDAGGEWYNKDQNGTRYTKHYITNISEDNGKGTISFRFNHVNDKDRYTVTFNAGTGHCATSSWIQTVSSLESVTLPEATINSDEWTFAGWSESVIYDTTTEPVVMPYGSSYRPTANCTLYAVYRKTNSNSVVAGSYVLDYSSESTLQRTGSLNSFTAKTLNYTALDGSTWVIKSKRSNGLVMEKNKASSIKVPVCPAPITTVEVTNSNGRIMKFSAVDFLGNNNPVYLAQSASVQKVATLDLNGKNQYTGYIYTTDATTAVTRVVVNYGMPEPDRWCTNPAVATGEIVITKHGVSTFSFPYPYIMPMGLRGALVKAEMEGDGYILHADYRYKGGDVVPAGEVLAICGKEGTYPISAVISDELRSTPDENDLHADYVEENGKYKTVWNEDTELDEYVYYYKLTTKNGENLGWYWGGAEGAPFYMSRTDRAYLVLPRQVANNVKSMRMFGEDEEEPSNAEATAIEQIESLQSGKAYDLNGRQLQENPNKGIYIKNGKKYIQK